MEENRYFKWKFFQGILLFFISCFWSLPKHAKHVFLHLLHANHDHDNFEVSFPPLKIIQISPQFIVDLDQNIPLEPCDRYNEAYKPRETKADIASLVLGSTPSNIQHRYIPLKLTHILNDLPPKHYEYLHVFDGEYDAIIAEKHIQRFEHFIDLFEIDHDDVCMRYFYKYMKGDNK
jgi:hypothetical protein